MKLDELYLGQRVRVCDEVVCYECRIGTVQTVINNGALVLHDTPYLDLDFCFGSGRLWGWSANELESLEQPS